MMKCQALCLDEMKINSSQFTIPINIIGGKVYMADFLIQQFPEHRVYIELFGGSGAVLFRKKPSELDVYNDKSSLLVNFFEVLRDDYGFIEQWIRETPISKELFYRYLQDIYNPNEDRKVRACKFFYVCNLSMNNAMVNIINQWYYKRPNNEVATKTEELYNKLQYLKYYSHILKKIAILNCDYKVVLKSYNRPDFLIYADPPYIGTTRGKNRYYLEEMPKEEQHKEMCEIINKHKGMFIISGFANEIYEKYLKYDDKIEVNLRNYSSLAHANKRKIEVLWFVRCKRKQYKQETIL